MSNRNDEASEPDLKVGPSRRISIPLLTLGAIIGSAAGAGVWAANQSNRLSNLETQLFSVQAEQRNVKNEISEMRSRMDRKFDAVAENLDYLVRDRKGPRPQPLTNAIP